MLSKTRGGGGDDACGALLSAAGGGHWPLATSPYPPLEPSRSAGGGAHRPLSPSSRCLALLTPPPPRIALGRVPPEPPDLREAGASCRTSVVLLPPQKAANRLPGGGPTTAAAPDGRRGGGRRRSPAVPSSTAATPQPHPPTPAHRLTDTTEETRRFCRRLWPLENRPTGPSPRGALPARGQGRAGGRGARKAPCVCRTLATSVCQLRHDQMEQGPTEPHAGRGTFLLSSGGAGGGYCQLTLDTGRIPTETQFPCRTPVARLVDWWGLPVYALVLVFWSVPRTAGLGGGGGGVMLAREKGAAVPPRAGAATGPISSPPPPPMPHIQSAPMTRADSGPHRHRIGCGGPAAQGRRGPDHRVSRIGGALQVPGTAPSGGGGGGALRLERMHRRHIQRPPQSARPRPVAQNFAAERATDGSRFIDRVPRLCALILPDLREGAVGVPAGVDACAVGAGGPLRRSCLTEAVSLA